MSDSYQNEIPKARINLKLDLHTGGAQKKTELPLKLLVTGDFSHGKETAALSERSKININKNNFNSVLADYSPAVQLTVENTLAADGIEENVNLTFRDMNDFTPKRVRNIFIWLAVTFCASSRITTAFSNVRPRI